MPTLAEAVRDFLFACQANGLSERSVKLYRGILAQFGLSIGTAAPLDSITAYDLRTYAAALNSQETRWQNHPQHPETPGHLSKVTVQGRISILRRFFGWCQIEYQRAPGTNPCIGLHPPRAHTSTEPRAIEVADLRRLIGACDESTLGRRDKALLCFMADSGSRSAGVLGLTRDRLFLDRHRAVVTEKGQKTRVVPFSVTTAEVLRAWLLARPLPGDAVFCSLGRFTTGDPLTPSGLRNLLQAVAKRAGVTGRINPHSFRHGFARAYMQQGGDLGTLQRLMGHANIRETVRYAVFTPAELEAFYEKFSPMNLVNQEGM